MEAKCTVFFEDPFWVAVFERTDQDGYSVARYVFGSEPSDAELYEFVRDNYQQLRFSLPDSGHVSFQKIDHFKRRQREAHRQAQQTGIGTKAQRAIQAEHERRKVESQAQNRVEREDEEQQKYLLKKERRKQKHRGR